jgi:hypothetical protein
MCQVWTPLFPDTGDCSIRIIILINIAIKGLFTTGYPAGYLMAACPVMAEVGGKR